MRVYAHTACTHMYNKADMLQRQTTRGNSLQSNMSNAMYFIYILETIHRKISIAGKSHIDPQLLIHFLHKSSLA